MSSESHRLSAVELHTARNSLAIIRTVVYEIFAPISRAYFLASRVLRVHFRQRRSATVGPDQSHRGALLNQVLLDPTEVEEHLLARTVGVKQPAFGMQESLAMQADQNRLTPEIRD